MIRNRRRLVAVLSLFAVLALIAAGCGGKSKTTSGGTTSGTPQTGGTLKLLGSGDVDHLDTVSAYYTASYTLERAYSRQLFSYPTTTDQVKATTPVADVATEVPTTANGGISSDGKTYTVHLRDGVQWNTTPPRAVTAGDFVVGIKRICNPVSPSGAPGYYENTIAGFKAFCDGFAKVGQTAAAMKAYITGHDVSGMKATDAKTIVFTLTQPATDFLNILTLPFASAAPAEYLDLVPDSNAFRQHMISDGPYMITKYTALKEIDFAKNPAWQQSSDPLRHQYVNNIVVTEGQDEGPVQQQIQAGTADMEFDVTVPTADVPQLKAAQDKNLGIFPGYDTNPYLVFNLQSPNNGGALGKVAVRQAIEYAINKVALGQVYGGPSLNTPLDQTIPPGNIGYQQFDMYQTPDHKGDPAKCKSMLASAGYPNGITLIDLARNSGKHPAVAQTVQASLKLCGVTTKIVQVSAGDYYGKYLSDIAATKRGVWDITEPGWVPDWFGNNGRSIIEPLFDGRLYGPNSTDYGDYNNPKVNSLIDQALTATDPNAAANFWHQADQQIMQDAAFVPFQTQNTPIYHSTRTQNAIYFPFAQNYDITNVWIKQ